MEFRRVRVGLAERASYGTPELRGLQGSTYDLVFSPTGTQIVPVADSVDYASSDTSLTVDWRSRRIGARGSARVHHRRRHRRSFSPRDPAKIVGPRGTLEVDYALHRARTSLAACDQAETPVTTDTGSEGGINFRTNIWRGLLVRWGRSWDARASSDIRRRRSRVGNVADPAPATAASARTPCSAPGAAHCSPLGLGARRSR